ncbi:MAG: cytochrome P450 [Pseudomonadota bacterium]|nr:cytochrome P450 [Pseudomonadota bacterium]
MRIDSAAASVSLDPRDAGFVQDPYTAYRAIRAASPRFKWEQYGYWCLARYADVAAVLRDRRFGRQIDHLMSRKERGLPEHAADLRPFYEFERHSLLELEPPAHTRIRSLVNRAFLSRQIDRLRPRIAAIANELIDGFAGHRETDLLPAFAIPIPVIVIAEVLGVPATMAPSLLDWSHKMVAMYQFRRGEEVERDAVAATQAFTAFMRAHVKERRQAPADDLLSALIAAEAEGSKLSEDEMIVTAILLLNAGHEATVHAIGNAVKALLEHDRQAVAEFASGGEVRTVVEELLRFDAPLHLFTRYALEDVDLDGLRLGKGEEIGLLLASANRDDARFPDPDCLIPARFPNPHVSFGAGIHFCVGAPLARLELEVALWVLFARLPGLRLTATPRYRDSYHFHGLESLQVAW